MQIGWIWKKMSDELLEFYFERKTTTTTTTIKKNKIEQVEISKSVLTQCVDEISNRIEGVREFKRDREIYRERVSYGYRMREEQNNKYYLALARAHCLPSFPLSRSLFSHSCTD